MVKVNKAPLPACQRLAADKITALLAQARTGPANADLWASIAGYAQLARSEAAAHAG